LRYFLYACLFAAALSANAIADVGDSEIDEVVVTATRRPIDLDDVSSAISVITRDEVLNGKITTDALSSQVGVFLQQTTPGQGAAIIRGLKGSAILHLVDGMPMSNAIFRSAPTPYLALVPSSAVERIEVIRGTSASLHGSQAVGGVVQVVSRVPNFDTAETQVERDILLSFDSAELAKSVRATIDIGNRRLAGSLSGEYLITGNRRIGGGERIAPSAYESKAARLLVSSTPSETKSWVLDVQLLEQPNTPRIDELVAGFGQTEPSSSEFFFMPSQRLFAHAGHENENGYFGFDWRVDAAWQRVVDDRVTRDLNAPTRTHEMNSSDLFAFSLNASGERGDMSWVSGMDLQTDEVSSERFQEDINTLSTLVVPSRFPDGAQIDQAAVFTNANWEGSAQHSFSGGLRFTDVHIDVPATTAISAATIDVRRVSGDLGWLFSVNEEWQVQSNIGIGFRAPNIFDLGTLGNRPGNRFNIPNTSLEEEHVQHFDIGVRRQTERSRFELMLYALEFDDRIASILTGAVTIGGRDVVQSVNAAESRIHGAEAGFEYQLSDRLRISSVLNYTWGQQRIATGPSEAADRIPPLSGWVGLRFDANTDWTINGKIASSGEQNRLSSRDVRDVRIDPTGTPGWTIIDASAGWHLDDVWHMTFSAENLLDKRYRVHGSGIDAPGRNFSVTVRANW
jgi:outer membrane receptor protein involved in Fe transport